MGERPIEGRDWLDFIDFDTHKKGNGGKYRSIGGYVFGIQRLLLDPDALHYAAISLAGPFRDLTTVNRIVEGEIVPSDDPEYIETARVRSAERKTTRRVDKVAVIDGSGAPLGAVVAYDLRKGLVTLRDPSKLAGDLVEVTYTGRHGHERKLAVPCGYIKEDENVVIVDDGIASGRTALAAGRLVEKAGGQVVGFSFLFEIQQVKSRKFTGARRLRRAGKRDPETHRVDGRRKEYYVRTQIAITDREIMDILTTPGRD